MEPRGQGLRREGRIAPSAAPGAKSASPRAWASHR
jgi:hypothetical protein